MIWQLLRQFRMLKGVHLTEIARPLVFSVAGKRDHLGAIHQMKHLNAVS